MAQKMKSIRQGMQCHLQGFQGKVCLQTVSYKTKLNQFPFLTFNFQGTVLETPLKHPGVIFPYYADNKVTKLPNLLITLVEEGETHSPSASSPFHTVRVD